MPTLEAAAARHAEHEATWQRMSVALCPLQSLDHPRNCVMAHAYATLLEDLTAARVQVDELTTELAVLRARLDQHQSSSSSS